MHWWIILIIVIAILLLLCFLLAVANFSGERFMERYQDINKKYSQKNISPLEFINYINKKYFEAKLQVVQISKLAGDAYSKGKLFLSTDTINKPSLASFTIIAHEMGHALQDKTGNKLKMLSKFRKLGRIFGLLMLPSIIAGAVMLLLDTIFFWWGVGLIGLGVTIFLLALILKLRTISIEKNASEYAIKFLAEVFDEKELKECKTFLKDARLTYWAEFLRLCLGWTAMSKKTKLFN